MRNQYDPRIYTENPPETLTERVEKLQQSLKSGSIKSVTDNSNALHMEVKRQIGERAKSDAMTAA